MNDSLKMSDRPTPETDAFSVKFQSVCGSKAWVPTDICRRFERERDEALKELEEYRSIAENIGAEKAVSEKEKAIRERDEAREALEDWENAAAHVEAAHPDERHCGCVPVLRKLLTDARQVLADEREAIGWDNKWRCAVEMAARAEVERDEARKICRELNDLVAYGLGQSGESWSIDAMRQAADAIQKAKSLEESK